MSRRAATKLDEEKLKLCGATGTSIRQTCLSLGISTNAFYKSKHAKRWQAIYDKGMAEAVTIVGGALYNKAIKGDTTAMLAFLKQYSESWKERPLAVELSGSTEVIVKSDLPAVTNKAIVETYLKLNGHTP